jgi:hypothetical protein
MKQNNTGSFSEVHSNLIGQVNNDNELKQLQTYSMMVSDLLKNERKYHIHPQVGKYAKIFRYVDPCQ